MKKRKLIDKFLGRATCIAVYLYWRVYGVRMTDLGIGTKLSIPHNRYPCLNVLIMGVGNSITIEPGARVSGLTVHIAGDGNSLVVRKGARCGSGFHIWLLHSGNQVTIGEGSTLMGGCIWTGNDHCEIEIGNDCMLANGLDLRCGDGHPIYSLETGKRINTATHIRIGSHVWTGKGVNVLKNVTIGSGSVIGAHAMVTKDVPENCVAAGFPAKVVKTGIRWER